MHWYHWLACWACLVVGVVWGHWLGRRLEEHAAAARLRQLARDRDDAWRARNEALTRMLEEKALADALQAKVRLLAQELRQAREQLA